MLSGWEGMSPLFFGAVFMGTPEVWPAFDWADPLLLDFSLREDEKLVRDSARGLAQ